MRRMEAPPTTRVSAVVLLCLIVACGSESAPAPDDHTLTEQSYTNDYFGFRMQLPESWAVASQDTNQALQESGNTALRAGSERLRAAMEEMAKKNTYQLLTVSEHAIGSPVESNAVFQVIAERISQAPGIRSGKDYLFQLERMLTNGSLPYTSIGPPGVEQVGTHAFFRQQFELNMNDRRIRQSYIVSVDRDYALGFILTYSTPEELEALQGILRSIRFE